MPKGQSIWMGFFYIQKYERLSVKNIPTNASQIKLKLWVKSQRKPPIHTNNYTFLNYLPLFLPWFSYFVHNLRWLHTTTKFHQFRLLCFGGIIKLLLWKTLTDWLMDRWTGLFLYNPLNFVCRVYLHSLQDI